MGLERNADLFSGYHPCGCITVQDEQRYCKQHKPQRSMPQQKPGRSKQDYGTPPEFLDRVKELLRIEQFDMDLAASPHNAVTRFYGLPENSLEKPWKCGNGWNWLNPPFARIEPWVQRAWEQWTEHSARTVVLVPASVGANWWARFVHRKAKVMMLNGRLTFRGERLPYVKDCALLLYSGNEGYYVWDWKHGRVMI